MLRHEMKTDAMAAVAEECLPGFQRGQHPGPAFLAQIVRNTAQPQNQLNQALPT